MTTITKATATPALSPFRRLIAHRPLSAYFVLAFGLMWVWALPLALSRNYGSGALPIDLPDALGVALFLLTTFSGPTVAALLVTAATEGRAGVVRLLKRSLQWRVGPQWYAVALVANLLIWLLAYGEVMGPALLVAAATHWPLLVSTFLQLVAFGVVVPSIAEEPGWRGFALPHLQRRYGPVRATLVLGALHGLWHLPVLFTVFFGPLPLANILPFVLTAVFATFLYTSLYNHTGGSVLLAILLHAASNATSGWLGTLLNEAGLGEPTEGLAGFLVSRGWLNVLAYGSVALLLLIATRGRLGYRELQEQ